MIRVIGFDEDQSSDLTAPDYSYAGLPEEYFSFPGQVITTMDGDDVSDRFEASSTPRSRATAPPPGTTPRSPCGSP